ncbi:TetR/AcrR family transcriptional regulator [Frankia gtarii]|uniref:TetR/AcrR family transcriptional regulator n=1 Tax=Frankia gtarii TaxID=2950102 RepID=UPI0021BFC45C|nr:TetR/AcrR family transcriptional regulator [Frankia gtarii]
MALVGVGGDLVNPAPGVLAGGPRLIGREGKRWIIVVRVAPSDVDRPKPRGRPRSVAVHEAVIEATIALLREGGGYPALSIEGVAARSGVTKRTIYRWWPSKGALVTEAYGALVRRDHPDPQTGSVAEDLRTVVRRLFRAVSRPEVAAVMRSMMVEAQSDPAFAAEFARFIAERRAVLAEVFRRGVERGELRPDLDLETAVDEIFGPYWYRLLARHAELTESFADSLVDHVLRGLHPRPTPDRR